MDVESALRMVDHGALTRDGIHFNTQPGKHWMNDAFQAKIEEMEAELGTMVNPVARGSPAGRVKSHVPRPLANRLGSLATEANVVPPTPSYPKLILGESTWDERWSTAGGLTGNYEHPNPTYKDAAGSKDLTSGSCGGD